MERKNTYAEWARPGWIVSPIVARFLAVGILVAGIAGTAHGQVCLLPENESGTVDLPLTCSGGYGNPEESIEITEGLPEGSSIRAQLSWSISNINRTPGGNLGGEIQTFTPTIILNLRGTGQFAGFSAFTPLSLNASGEEHSGNFNPFFPSQSVALELVALEGEALTFNPNFSTLRFEAGSAFGLPTTTGEADLQLDQPGVCVGGSRDGSSCARDNQCPDSSTNGNCVGGTNDGLPCSTNGNCPGGECVNPGSCSCPGGPCVPSYIAQGFFDVNYSIDYVGKAGSQFEGFSGTQTGTIRIQTGAFTEVYMRPVGGFGREIDALPGDTIAIDTFVRQTVPKKLSAYQVTADLNATPIGANASGSITHRVDPPVVDDTRSDWAFFNVTEAPLIQPGFLPEPTALAVFFTLPPDIPLVTSGKYLATFYYEVSPSAQGDFEINFVAPGTVSNSLTIVSDENLNGIPFDDYGAIIHLPTTGCDDPVEGPPFLVHGTAAAGETFPCTGYIDPRLESDNGVDLNVGVSEVTMVFNEPVFKVGGGGTTPADATSFIVTETGGGVAPSVVNVTTADNISYTVTLDRPITLQEWTTIRADVVDTCNNPIDNQGDLGPGVAEPDRLDMAFLPGDVNQTEQVSPQDLINLRQFLTAGAFQNDCADILYFDIDRDGVLPEPQDLLRFRQMIAGTAPATRNWTLAVLNNTQP